MNIKVLHKKKFGIKNTKQKNIIHDDYVCEYRQRTQTDSYRMCAESASLKVSITGVVVEKIAWIFPLIRGHSSRFVLCIS